MTNPNMPESLFTRFVYLCAQKECPLSLEDVRRIAEQATLDVVQAITQAGSISIEDLTTAAAWLNHMQEAAGCKTGEPEG